LPFLRHPNHDPLVPSKLALFIILTSEPLHV
jgi:hypothetical protein